MLSQTQGLEKRKETFYTNTELLQKKAISHLKTQARQGCILE